MNALEEEDHSRKQWQAKEKARRFKRMEFTCEAGQAYWKFPNDWLNDLGDTQVRVVIEVPQ